MHYGALIAVAATLVFIAPRVARAVDAAPFQGRLDQVFQSWTRGNVPGCAAGVMRNGKWLAKDAHAHLHRVLCRGQRLDALRYLSN
jgi:hypothetical protein